MSAFLAIFAREFRLRRILLLGALFVGLAAPIIPRLQGARGVLAAESALDAALFLGLITGVLFAALLGSSAAAGDLSHGRLGFDFVRPISGWAIWAGRFGAAVALLFASAGLVLLPAILSGGTWGDSRTVALRLPAGNGLDSLGTFGTAVLGLLGCTVLLFLVHAIGVFYASRSAWLAVDLAALAAIGLIVAGALSRLQSHWALEAFGAGAIALSAMGAVALIAASCAQVVRGRIDLARGHRALSIVLWGCLLLGALGLEAASRWVLSAEVGDLETETYTQVAPRGGWFALSGTARRLGTNYASQFLIDGASGRTVRLRSLPPGGIWGGEVSFSGDGRWAAWHLQQPGQSSEVVRLDLAHPGSRPEALQLGLPYRQQLGLSPTGRWCAAFDSDRLLVFELATSRLVASIALDGPSVYEGIQGIWTAPDRFRWYTKRPSEGASEDPRQVRIEITEMALPAGRPERVGEIRAAPLGFPWQISTDGGTVLVRERTSERWLLFDGRTGGFRAPLEFPRRTSALLLPLGRVAAVQHGTEGANARTLVLSEKEGQEILRLDLPRYQYIRLGSLATPTVLLAAGTSKTTEDPAAWHLLALDLVNRKVTEIGRGVPAGGFTGEAGTLGSRLVKTAIASFAVWDPATGKLVPLRLQPAE